MYTCLEISHITPSMYTFMYLFKINLNLKNFKDNSGYYEHYSAYWG
jgi:hypothetical protein